MLEYISVRIISSITYITNATQIKIGWLTTKKRLKQFPSVQVFFCALKCVSACSAPTSAERLAEMAFFAIISKSEATRGARRWSWTRRKAEAP